MPDSRSRIRVDDLKQAAGQVKGAADGLMRNWRSQAKRSDRVGDVSYRTLELVHRGADLAAKGLSQLEKATQPPARSTKPQPYRPPASKGSGSSPTGAGKKDS